MDRISFFLFLHSHCDTFQRTGKGVILSAYFSLIREYSMNVVVHLSFYSYIFTLILFNGEKSVSRIAYCLRGVYCICTLYMYRMYVVCEHNMHAYYYIIILYIPLLLLLLRV